MKIGLLGVSFLSGNLGCQALSYSCLEILNIIAKEKQTTFDVFVMLSYFTDKKKTKFCFSEMSKS